PQTIISEPSQTAVCPDLPENGESQRTQLSVSGLYLPSVASNVVSSYPPNINRSSPSQIPVASCRDDNAPVSVVGVQESRLRLYAPPEFRAFPPETPPQTTSLDPVQTPTCSPLAVGALELVIGTHVFVPGTKLAPSPSSEPDGQFNSEHPPH